MEGTAVVVGIDVSKDRLDVHVRPSGETLTVERAAAGLDALALLPASTNRPPDRGA